MQYTGAIRQPQRSDHTAFEELRGESTEILK